MADKKDVRNMKTSGLIDPEALEVDDQPEQERNKDVLLKAIMQELFSNDNLSTKTELNAKQVLVHAQARVFEEIYQTGVIGRLLDWIETNMLSHKRASRKEYVKFLQNIDLDDDDAMEKIKRGLLGG
jgi:hypothetical protein